MWLDVLSIQNYKEKTGWSSLTTILITKDLIKFLLRTKYLILEIINVDRQRNERRQRRQKMRFGGDGREGEIVLRGEKIKEKKNSIRHANRRARREQSRRIKGGWMNWWIVSAAFLGRRIKKRTKRKVFKSVVKPNMICNSET